MRAALAVLVVAGALGCGGDQPDTGPCLRRSGLYHASFAARSGDCGPINAVIVNADEDVSAICRGRMLPLDVCDGDVDYNCDLAGTDGQVLAERGTLRWRHDGSSGGGEVYVELRDKKGAVLCNGIYDVSFAK
jgi:hypothetical protein